MSQGDWLVLVGSVLTLVGTGGGLTALILVSKQGRKLRADAAQVLTSAAVTMVKPLEDRLTAANAEVDQLTARVRECETRIYRLATMLQHWHRLALNPDTTMETLRARAEREQIS